MLAEKGVEREGRDQRLMSFKGKRRARLKTRVRVKMVVRRRKRLVREVRAEGGTARLASLKVPRMISNRTMGKPAA
jgi:hypothetical protein